MAARGLSRNRYQRETSKPLRGEGHRSPWWMQGGGVQAVGGMVFPSVGFGFGFMEADFTAYGAPLGCGCWRQASEIRGRRQTAHRARSCAAGSHASETQAHLSVPVGVTVCGVLACVTGAEPAGCQESAPNGPRGARGEGPQRTGPSQRGPRGRTCAPASEKQRPSDVAVTASACFPLPSGWGQLVCCGVM